MDKIDASYVLRALHNNRGRPRLEIEGIGEPSPEALYFRCFSSSVFDGSERAVYISRDFDKDPAYQKRFGLCYIWFPRGILYEMAEEVLREGRSSRSVKGRRVFKEQRENFSNFIQSEAELEIGISLVDGEPRISIDMVNKSYSRIL